MPPKLPPQSSSHSRFVVRKATLTVNWRTIASGYLCDKKIVLIEQLAQQKAVMVTSLESGIACAQNI